MTDTCIVLAGGLGTRLREVVQELPKVMAPINGRPFLEYQIEFLYQQGIRNVMLATGYKHEVINHHFSPENIQNLKPLFREINIQFSHETEPLGTGGAVLKALENIHQPVFLLNGDSFFDIKLETLVRKKEETNARIVLALRRVDDVSRYGAVEINPEGQIIRFVEKGDNKGPGLINGGVYLFDAEWFKGRAPSNVFSLEKEILADVKENDYLAAVVFDNYFIDIGVPEHYKLAQYEFKNRQ